MRRALSVASLAWLAMAGLVGCDKSGVGRVVPVKGIVSFDGKTVASGSLVFKPDSTKGNQSTFEPAGQIGADGSYSLFTGPKEGAPVGWYRVGVVAQELNPTDPYAAPKSLIPAKYSDADSSGLTIEVVEAPAAVAYDIKLSK